MTEASGEIWIHVLLSESYTKAVEIAVVVSRQCSVCCMSKVYVAESLRLSSQLVSGDSAPRR